MSSDFTELTQDQPIWGKHGTDLGQPRYRFGATTVSIWGNHGTDLGQPRGDCPYETIYMDIVRKSWLICYNQKFEIGNIKSEILNKLISIGVN